MCKLDHSKPDHIPNWNHEETGRRGTKTVKVKLYCWIIWCFVLVLVQQPPVFTQVPDTQELIEGAELELTCQAKGKPIPKINWYKNDKVVRQAGKTRLQTVEDKDALTTTSTVSTKDVDVKRFDGTYVIEASNVAGTAVHEATLVGEHRVYY